MLKLKTEWQNAQAEYDESYNNKFVKSPINGVISTTNLTIGSVVSQGQQLVTVSNNKSTQVEYQLPLFQAQQAKIDQKIKFTIDFNSFDGVVSYSSSKINPT